VKLLKNQKGVSLVEAMIGIGIMSAAGIAYMTHVQTTAKNEARQKIRNSITQLEAQAYDYLKAREVCNTNVSKAFKDVPLSGSDVSGKDSYKVLKNKEFTDGDGNVSAKDIFKKGDIFDGGRIYVSDVIYKLTDLSDLNIPKAPWNKSGTIKIGVEFQTCRNNAVVFHKNDSGVLTEACPEDMRNTTMKYYDKLAAFKIDPITKKIIEQPVREQIIDPVTGKLKWVETDKTKSLLTCADSQDALVDAANSYTDEKVCLLDARLQAQLGREGKTSCDYEVKIIPRSIAHVGAKTGSLTLPPIFAPGSLKIKLLGGGGGGAGGWKSAGGLGGKAGSYKQEILPDQLMGVTCDFVVPAGVSGVGQKTVGKKGLETKFTCSSKGINVVATGGDGGQRKGDDSNSGAPGENAPWGGGVGGAGGEYNKKGAREHGKAGGVGAGGGGGTSDGDGRPGGAGGPGKMELVWLEVNIYNQLGQKIDLEGNPIE